MREECHPFLWGRVVAALPPACPSAFPGGSVPLHPRGAPWDRVPPPPTLGCWPFPLDTHSLPQLPWGSSEQVCLQEGFHQEEEMWVTGQGRDRPAQMSPCAEQCESRPWCPTRGGSARPARLPPSLASPVTQTLVQWEGEPLGSARHDPGPVPSSGGGVGHPGQAASGGAQEAGGRGWTRGVDLLLTHGRGAGGRSGTTAMVTSHIHLLAASGPGAQR